MDGKTLKVGRQTKNWTHKDTAQALGVFPFTNKSRPDSGGLEAALDGRDLDFLLDKPCYPNQDHCSQNRH